MVDESKWVERFTTYPIRWFAALFFAAIVLLWVALQVVSLANTKGPNQLKVIFGGLGPSLQAIDVSSAALQAVIGTAVVGASAIVAVLIAVAALRASEQSNRIATNQSLLAKEQNRLAGEQNKLADEHARLARQNNRLTESQNDLARQANELNDPDYVLSHQAYGAYRRYGFLFGSLIASYRIYRHESDLASYPQPDPAQPAKIVRPKWDSTLTELRDLILHTPFQVAALEAAKVLDLTERASAAENKHADAHQHRLRKAFASVLAALEQNTRAPESGASPERSLTWLLGQATLLDGELKRGIAAVLEIELPDESPPGDGKLLEYLKRWMGKIEPVQVGEDFKFAVRANAFAGEEFGAHLGGGLPSWQDSFKGLLSHVFIENKHWKSGRCVDPYENGLHRGMSIAALCGDHVTPLELREQASTFARSQGWKPVVVPVRKKLSRVRSRQDDKAFYIFHVTRRTLPLLFDENVLNPYTRGCVIVDGVRSGDMADIEAEAALTFERSRVDEQNGGVEPQTKTSCVECDPCPACGGCARCGSCDKADPSDMDILIHQLTIAAYHGYPVKMADGQTLRASRESIRLSEVSDEGTGTAGAEQAESMGPKLAWVGLDYRQFGAEPPTRQEKYFSEMWSVLSRERVAVSDEVRELTEL